MPDRGGLGPARHIELREDARDVHRCGLLGLIERSADPAVGRALSDQCEDLPLTCVRPNGASSEPGIAGPPSAPSLASGPATSERHRYGMGGASLIPLVGLRHLGQGFG
jgi:hypothetical protein